MSYSITDPTLEGTVCEENFPFHDTKDGKHHYALHREICDLKNKVNVLTKQWSDTDRDLLAERLKVEALEIHNKELVEHILRLSKNK